MLGVMKERCAVNPGGDRMRGTTPGTEKAEIDRMTLVVCRCASFVRPIGQTPSPAMPRQSDTSFHYHCRKILIVCTSMLESVKTSPYMMPRTYALLSSLYLYCTTMASGSKVQGHQGNHKFGLQNNQQFQIGRRKSLYTDTKLKAVQ